MSPLAVGGEAASLPRGQMQDQAACRSARIDRPRAPDAARSCSRGAGAPRQRAKGCDLASVVGGTIEKPGAWGRSQHDLGRAMFAVRGGDGLEHRSGGEGMVCTCAFAAILARRSRAPGRPHEAKKDSARPAALPSPVMHPDL